MEEQDPEGSGTGKRSKKGPRPNQAGSGAECWEGAVPEILIQDTMATDERSQCFRQFRYDEVDGPQEVCCQLYGLCNHWLEPERRTKKQMLDLVILEQFLAVLPQEMQCWVRGCQPESSSQAVALAEEFLLSQAEKRQAEQVWGPSVKVEAEFSEAEGAPSEEGQRTVAQKCAQDVFSHVGGDPGDGKGDGRRGPGGGQRSRIDPHPNQAGSGAECWEREIMAQDTLTADVRRQRFRQFCYHEASGPGEVCHQLHGLCNHWLEPEKNTKKQMLDLVILEQLLNILPQEMQCWVRGCGPETSSQAVALAEGFLLSQAEEKKQAEQVWGPSVKMEAKFSEAEGAPLEDWQRVEIQECTQGALSHAEDIKETTEEFKGFSLEKVKEEEPECNFQDRDGPERQEGSHGEKMRETPIPCQGGDFHEVTYTAEEIHKCLDWGLNISDQTQYDTDLQKHPVKKAHICLQCGKSFLCGEELMKHQRIHIGENLYCCSDCDERFSEKSSLIQHQRETSHHSGGEPFIGSESEKSLFDGKAHKCFLCGKCFKCRSHLLLHQTTHTEEKPFACSECGKRFSDRRSHTKHLRTHTGEKPFECSECGKRFSESGTLQQHQRTHRGENPFECSECGKTLSCRGSLQEHQRIHTGEKPFQCSECGMKFSWRVNLKRHQRIHRGEKPFECSECGKRFTQKSTLQQHQKTHKRGNHVASRTVKRPSPCFTP